MHNNLSRSTLCALAILCLAQCKAEPAKRTTEELPRRFHDVKMNPQLQAGLKRLIGAYDGDLQALANLHYRIVALSALDDCTRGHVSSNGVVDLLIEFAPSTVPNELQAKKYEVKSATISPADQRLVAGCLDRLIPNSKLEAKNAELTKTGVSAPMLVRFPIRESGVYSFLKTGDMKYMSRAYDGGPDKRRMALVRSSVTRIAIVDHATMVRSSTNSSIM